MLSPFRISNSAPSNRKCGQSLPPNVSPRLPGAESKTADMCSTKMFLLYFLPVAWCCFNQNSHFQKIELMKRCPNWAVGYYFRSCSRILQFPSVVARQMMRMAACEERRSARNL